MAMNRKPKGLQILRTPAPDEVTHIRAPQGGSGYGQDAPQPSSLPPGKGGPQSILGQNMRESTDDPIMDQVLAKGVAGRGDFAPADDNDQLRPVSAGSYPVAAQMKRQQSDLADIGKNALPAKSGASAAKDPSLDEYGGVKS